MTKYLNNANGDTYEIIACYQSRNGAEHYLLANHGGNEDDKADTVTQYIVAHDYDSHWRTWARGEYFPLFMEDAQGAAFAAWKKLICDEADNF